MKTVQHYFQSIFCLCVCAFLLVSCHNEESDSLGNWKPIKWEETDYEQIKEDGNDYFSVSSDGGSFQFHCKNYDIITFLVGEVKQEGEASLHIPFDEEKSIGKYFKIAENDIFDVVVEGGDVSVTIKPNNGTVRFVDIEIAYGDVRSFLRFKQRTI